MAYYQIDWDAIRALTPREQLEVLADIAATVPALVAQERVRVVGRTVERHAAERPWGAQSRAAEELGIGKARVGQLWTEYAEVEPSGVVTSEAEEVIRDYLIEARDEARDDA